MLTEADASAVVAVVGGIASCVAAWFSFRANKNAKESNDAVNHRHLGGTPRLYDLILDLKAWADRWDTLPSHINSAEKLADYLETQEHRLQALHDDFREHDAWERKAKYGHERAD